jgi:hypothetical protein
MKRKRREEIELAVAEALGAIYRRFPPKFHTIDVVVAVPNGPLIIAFPVDPAEFARTGHATVDLTRTPYKVVEK